jgi:hypothetical protein
MLELLDDDYYERACSDYKDPMTRAVVSLMGNRAQKDKNFYTRISRSIAAHVQSLPLDSGQDVLEMSSVKKKDNSRSRRQGGGRRRVMNCVHCCFGVGDYSKRIALLLMDVIGDVIGRDEGKVEKIMRRIEEKQTSFEAPICGRRQFNIDRGAVAMECAASSSSASSVVAGVLSGAGPAPADPGPAVPADDQSGEGGFTVGREDAPSAVTLG